MTPIKHLETDMENMHSLPNLEEARTQSIISSGGNKYSGKKKRTIALIVVLVAVIATAVGFTIAVTQNKRGEKEANALANNENGGSDDDDDDDADGDDENAGDDDGADLSDDKETDDDERLTQVELFLTTSGISSLTNLQNSATPQHKAAAWISNGDERELDIPETIDEEDSYKFVQRYVMALFYYALGGSEWTRTVNFLSGDDVCDWNFDLSIRIDFSDDDNNNDPTDYDYGVSCWDDDANDYGDVVSWIFMPDNNLVGSLPSEIGLLTDLTHISLFNNKISGSIPETFEQLENLNFWAMESNEITGPLPSWINTLEFLEYLGLGSNSLSGELPSFAGSSLLELSLDSNNFEGSIDNLNGAISLVTVYLNDNMFTGELTEETWEALIDGELTIADLSNNQLTGSFPAYFYWIEQIDLSSNQLSGTIAAPSDENEVEDLPTMIINLSDNDLTGPIPSNIDILVSLVSLDLSGNDLTSTIPMQLGSLEMLESLYLSENTRLTAGTIPDLRGCELLTEVSMASTGRTGTIPDWFGSTLKNLELLDLHSNDLEKTIPTNLGLLENLSVLMLNRNLLTGNVPSELGNLEFLDILFLDHNSLTGSMQPICQGAADEIEFLTVDTTVADCDRNCCSTYCTPRVDSCNRPNGTVKKFDYNFISRETFVYGEDFKLADVDSPEN